MFDLRSTTPTTTSNMSSKPAPGLTPAMLANIKSAMKNLETFSVNWAAVKDETGVSSNGNA